MGRFRSRRATGYMAVVLALAVAAVVVVASAQAAPVKKKFDAYVIATDSSSTSFMVTLVNDLTSQQTLGSADFAAPGLSVASIAPTAATSSGGHNWTVCTGSGGSTCSDVPNNVVEFRANSSGDALAPGESVSFNVSADPTGCTNAKWIATAKQSNDYSGTNNIFNIAANDLTPLGSFVFAHSDLTPAPIETVVSGIHVPQIYVKQPASISIVALDTCKNVDTDYPNYRDGSTPTLNPTKGADFIKDAVFSALSWSNGVGTATVTPKDVEVGDQFSVNDSENGINATSISTNNNPTFDVVETICGVPGEVCNWNSKDNPGFTAKSTMPNDNKGEALGLGFKPVNQGEMCGVGSPVGDSIYIDPFQYDPNSTLTIVLTYPKGLAPKPASSLVTCKGTDNADGTTTWSRTAIPPCGNTPVAPCAAAQSISGGAVQVTLYLKPTDPHSGGFSP